MSASVRPPDPFDEAARLEALRECGVLDTPPEPEFDDLTLLASEVCQVPIALISLVDSTRQWFKSRTGLSVCQTARDVAFCAHAIARDGPFIVPDAALDERFRDNPLVTGEPFIRFYAGVPLTTRDGYRLGTLCAIDTRPRQLSRAQLFALTTLATQASTQLELRRSVARLADATRELRRSNAELERLRSEADAASRAKSAFLVNMSHEFRTPMTSVLGYIELLRDGSRESLNADGRAQALEAITRNGEQLLKLVNDILELSNIESGEVPFSPAAFEVSAVVERVVASHRAEADRKGLRLETGQLGALPGITADARRVAQVLSSLIDNAIKFTADGTVRVTGSWSPGQDGRLDVSLRVEDTGIGISPEQARRLFLPFVQTDDSTTRRFGGTGLGLAIAHRLACIMGGEIRVEPAVPDGRGSVFTFTFQAPLANSDRPADARPVPGPAASLKGRRILLAEDCPDSQRLFKHHLASAGAFVEIAHDGRSALCAASAATHAGRPFDLILMDMQMPEMDGYTAVRRLRVAGDRTPVVALTAHALTGDRDRCLAAGCDDYTTKPISRDSLLDCCSQWVARRGSRRAAAGRSSDAAPLPADA